MIPAELLTNTLEPGTPVMKVIPPRLVEPYLSGQRSVIAGYVYRAQDCSCRTPADFFECFALGYEGSEFAADMPELYIMRWTALDMSGSLVAVTPGGSHGPVSGIPEFFTLPVPIPVGTEIGRVTVGPEEFIARYDGQVWLRPLREA